jgi:hypothetical protein
MTSVGRKSRAMRMVSSVTRSATLAKGETRPGSAQGGAPLGPGGLAALLDVIMLRNT